MKITAYRIVCLFTLLAAALAPLHLSGNEAEMTADAIMKQHVEQHNLDSEVEFVTMVTIGADGAITRHAILFLTQKDENGKYGYLLRVVSPKKYNGVGLLARYDGAGELERYFYLPALGQVKKVVGKGKSPNFLGSNFTYDDLLKENPENYVYERLDDDDVDGIPCFVVRAKMANLSEEEEPTYAYRDIYIGKEDYNMYKVMFISNDTLEPAKILTASEYRSAKVDGPTMRPLRAQMRDLEEGSMSVLTVMRSRFNEPLDKKYFTPEGLATWSPEQKDEILGTFRTASK